MGFDDVAVGTIPVTGFNILGIGGCGEDRHGNDFEAVILSDFQR
jgi:hypothetical protein